jgi:CubicO group peptidase (beta-lactamase class C family)
LAFGLLWLVGTATTGADAQDARLDARQMVFPGKDWAKASPQSQGVDPAKLKAAVDYLARSLKEYGGAGTVFMVHNGYVIWAEPECDRQYQIYSATKSFTSTVMGLLIDDGKVTLGTLAKDLEPTLAKQYPTVTLRHFATMTSGYDSVGGSYEFDRQGRGDSWNPGPPAPPLFSPGSKFRYWDDAMSQFGSVLTKTAGEPLDRLFKRRIADPIGMTKWRWTENDSPVGRVLSWTGGIHTSSRELARFGHLFLNRGNWNGRELISASWVAQATSVQVPASVPNDDMPRSCGAGVYGYNWWANGVKPNGQRLWPGAPPRTFYANGLHNNVCIVVPEWNMVVARTNGGKKEGSANSPPNVNEIWSGFFARLAEGLLGVGMENRKDVIPLLVIDCRFYPRKKA